MAETTDAKDDAFVKILAAISGAAPKGQWNKEWTNFRNALSLAMFFEAQREWSYAIFGPREHRGPKGPLDHLRKEAKEAYDETDPEKQKEEIADCLFLVFDAAHRAGMDLNDLSAQAFLKLLKNKKRTWPDWRQVPADKAVEHDRSSE